MNEIELLEKLKKGLLSVNKEIKDTKKYFGHSNPKWENSEKAQNYYLWNLKNNLYQNINQKQKLGSGCKAIRSSAALIYNTLLSGQIKLKTGEEYRGYKSVYEIPFRAIKNDKDSTHTAKLDAGLLSVDENTLLLFEAKCMEWFDKNPKKLKKAYLKEDRYLYKESAAIFKPLFNDFINPDEIIDKDAITYKSKYIRYDAFQMLIHCLGIYNWCLGKKKDSKKNIKTIQLINLIWDYECEEYKKEEKEGLEFKQFANSNLREEFRKLGVNFSIEYVRYSDFLKRVDWSNDMEHQKYLKRYEIK
ncbi:MAG: hypothetical protein J6Y36_01300 [Treponema sp.]|nr:hypothetical protein [Treponema sp.]